MQGRRPGTATDAEVNDIINVFLTLRILMYLSPFQKRLMHSGSFALILAVRYMGKLYDLNLVSEYKYC